MCFVHQVMQDKHDNFNIKESGLIIRPDLPFLGASPDAISHCTCHGSGCVEVKCPFTLKDLKITEAVENGAKIGLRKSRWYMEARCKTQILLPSTAPAFCSSIEICRFCHVVTFGDVY